MNEGESLVFDDFAVGETHQQSIRTVTEADIRLFIGATGSTHPSHVDRSYAGNHPIFEDLVAQGVLILGIADGFVADTILHRAHFGLNYGHESVEYRAPVYPGDTLGGHLEITDSNLRDDRWGILTIEVELTNQDNGRVLLETHQVLIATAAFVREYVE